MRDLEDLLRQMTLQEKVSMLAGANMWQTVSIERLGIPAIKVTDGPNGARGGGGFTDGIKAACFPAGIALASTWNPAMVGRVGQALAQEARTKGASVLLAPTINIHRSPLNGRNFECYSEDPYLTGRMAVAYIQGVQSQGVGATVKHYVCNDSEYQRNSISSEVDERTLRETYLAPFQAAVQEGKPWAIMASYNKINGTFASENPYTLTDILRKEWGFDGVAMSDWFGTQSTADSVNAGLDLEMPGPANWRGEKLLQAFERGEVSEATIDESVRRLLRLIERADAFEHPHEGPEQAIDRPEHRAVAREAAAEGIVLLKNTREMLPLQAAKLTSLAIIGPNAKTARIMAGGSAQVNAHYAITPFEAIVARAGEHVQVGYEMGCTNHNLLPLMDTNLLTTDTGEHRMEVEYFNSSDLSGAPVASALNESSILLWMGNMPERVNAQQFSVRATAHFTPETNGGYSFSLVSAGLSRLLLDGQEVIDNWTQQRPGETFFGMGSAEISYSIELTGGQAYTLTLEYSKSNAPLAAVRLGCLMPLPANALERAAALAASSDVALVFAGLSAEWESEGFDRPDLELVGEQQALIEAVAAANKNTVVVLNTGSPISMPWLNQVAAVIEAWYPGQECGNAIADVLFGDVNPSGKLTETFPLRLQDNPAYINYPGENGQVRYGEGIFVGYRYYEKKQIETLFPFGFGLSYTSFSYDALNLSAREIGPDETLNVSIDITNTGQRAGQEIVQLYIRDKAASVQRPDKELKAFAKVHLEAGERQAVTLSITRDALAYYDILKRAWIAEAGEFEVLVGSSARDIHATGTFTLTESSRFGGPADQKHARLSLNNTLAQLLDDPAAHAVLTKYFPPQFDIQQVSMVSNWRLEQLASMAPEILTPEILQSIARDLEQLEI
ncbi:MAG TPA: glycoside hydrolase family 3 C-terminal domain-containing protein [Ktedonobacteraceae bacterium]|nr:glycoside hydrolase family 3 C-terminal domain-containing protein [Ktedonobacteraceae bacterium]